MAQPSDPGSSKPDPSTVIGLKRGDQVIVTLVLVVGGAALLAVLPLAADWLLSNLPWIPWQGPFELVLTGEEGLTRWGLAGIGAVLGLLLAFFVVADEPVVEISERHLLITKGDERHRYARSQVRAVGIEKKHLVVFDHDDVELLHLKVDRRDDIVAALQDHDWPSP